MVKRSTVLQMTPQAPLGTQTCSVAEDLQCRDFSLHHMQTFYQQAQKSMFGEACQLVFSLFPCLQQLCYLLK
jgi:hypothetical protein